ncbi:hypothetical protein [Chlamydiifrater volucris]|uniref:hypothetical protein n=1 Tax=Chlamydiifrater volucris TaxID=2681470 RepID=UPI0032B28858
MSISKPSSTQYTPTENPTSYSLKEQISANLQIVEEIIKGPLSSGSPSTKAEELKHQITSLFSLGYSSKLIAEALSVSDLYLKTLLKKNMILTTPQYNLVLANCRDLSESSGSSSTQTAPQSLLDPSLHEDIRSESSKEKYLDSHLPLKKRKISLQSLPNPTAPSLSPLKDISQTEALQQERTYQEQPPQPGKRKEKSHHIDDPHLEISSSSEEEEEPSTTLTQEQLVILVKTIQHKNRERGLGQIMCPNRQSVTEGKHSCLLCQFTQQLLRGNPVVLVRQLKMLLEYTDVSKLSSALASLFAKESTHAVLEKRRLSNLEAAIIIDKCEIGDAICLPGYQNPASQLRLYQSLDNVIRQELKSPLTQAIWQAWQTDRPPFYPAPAFPRTVFIINETGHLQKLSAELLSTLFSKVAHRYFAQRKDKTSRGKLETGMPPRVSDFLADMTLATLEALKRSGVGSPFLLSSPEGPLFPWSTVDHVFSLILVSNPTWKVAVLPSKLSFKTTEELSLPEEVICMLQPSMQQFAAKNRIYLPGVTPYSK